MRMLHISSTDDLIANSMDILEPAPVDADGNEREDGTFTFPLQILNSLFLHTAVTFFTAATIGKMHIINLFHVTFQ